MRGLVLALLLLPVAAAASAYPDGATWGEREAQVPLRVLGALRVDADGAVEVALAPPQARPETWTSAPAQLTSGGGLWRGLDEVRVLWLRRDREEPLTVEVSDETQEGLLLEWPAQRETSAGGSAAVMLAGALALAGRRLLMT